MAGLSGDARRLLQIQFVLLLVVAVVAWVAFGGADAAMAAAFGAAAALLNSWLFGRRVAQATEAARTDPGSETFVLYVGALQRFVLIAAAFGVGMGALELEPVPLLGGFAVVYGGFVLVRPGATTVRPGVSKDS